MNSINLMQAYVIENLRSFGYSNGHILSKVNDKDIEEFKKVKENMDFTLLYEIDDAEGLKTVLEDGYQVSFLTFNGLKNLIKLRFDQHADKDYQVDEFVLTGLELDASRAGELRKMLSPNWQMTEVDGQIKVEPAK